MRWMRFQDEIDDEEQLRRIGREIIGRLVRERRRQLGWSQIVLEVRSGVDQTIISRLENGKLHSMSLKKFSALVGALGGLGLEPYPSFVGRPPAPIASYLRSD